MINAFLHRTIESIILTGSGLGTLMMATAEIADERIFGISIQTVRELGSFGLIALLVLSTILGAKALIPMACKFFDDTRKGFMDELKLEREMREKNMDAFRDMLSSHKGDLGAKMGEVKVAIEEGNRITKDLVTEMKSRPCQK
jgi:hypothetical protein